MKSDEFTSLPSEMQILIDRICVAFENQLKQKPNTEIDEFCNRVEPGLRAVLFRELVKVDLETRAPKRSLEDFLSKHPNEAKIVEEVFMQNGMFSTSDTPTEEFDSDNCNQSISLRISSGDGQLATKKLPVPGQYIIGSDPSSDIKIYGASTELARRACLIAEPEFVLFINFQDCEAGVIGKRLNVGEKIIIDDTELVWVSGNLQHPTSPGQSKASTSGLDLQIDGFEFIRELGRGSFGSVYLAKQLGTERPVAIKTLLPNYSADPQLRRIFLREASILANLQHPNIVRSYGTGLQEELLYFVMEYVPCEDLQRLIANTSLNKRFKIAVGIITKVLMALDFAHNQGIVHRDVKLSNILGFKHEGRLHVKLSDFGLAKCFETAGYSGVTATETICGTLAYMSPQQMRDSKYATPASDIYSTAVALYLLLTKRFPHDQESHSELILAKLNSEPPPAKSIDPQIPEALSNVIARSLSRDTAQRYRSASELADALKGALELSW